MRVAVTGRTVGPPLFESLEVMGRDETLRRLRAALERLDALMNDAHVPTTDVPTAEVPVTYAPDVVVPHEHERAPSGRRRRRTPLGIAVRVVVVLAAIGLTYYVVTLYQVWSTGRRDEARPVDAIVVLGAAQYDGRPSPQLAARLDHVVELWPRGLAPIVVVTGGKQPEDRFTEAEASARYLVDHGVPEDALVFENAGRSTYESLEGVADELHARGSANRPARHRPVPRPAEPADRRGGGSRGLRVADRDERRDRWDVVHEAPPGGRRHRGRKDHRVRSSQWADRLIGIHSVTASWPGPRARSHAPWGVV